MNKSYLIPFIIFLFAFVVRVYKVTEIPIDGDEAALGYYAYSLSENLSDEYGNKLPLYFPSIGDYKYPMYSYLSVVFIKILGLSVFSSRLLSVVAGSILPVIIYYLTKLIFQSKLVSFYAVLLTVLSPYGIIFSRGVYESNLGMVAASLGILFIVSFVINKNKKHILFATIFFLVAAFSYSASRLFIVLFSLSSFFLLVPEVNSNKRKILKFFLLFIILIAGLSFLDQRSRVRANDIGFLKDPAPKEYLVESIHEDGLANQGRYVFLTRIFHNKITATVLWVGRRYLEHFSPVFLFVSSNPTMQKYSVPNIGLFYYFEFLTMLVGIFALSKVNKKFKLIPVIWVLVAPIPSALSIETPNPIRMLVGLPGFIILSSLGLWWLTVSLKRSQIMASLIVMAILVHFIYSMHQYRVHEVYAKPWFPDTGMSEVVSSINEIGDKFEKIVFPGDPYIFFLFYNKVKPQDFLGDSVITTEKMGSWERVESYGKVIFKMPYDCPKVGRLKVLYVCKGEEVPQNSNLLEVFRFKDGRPAILLLEFVPYSQRKNDVLPDRVHYMKETDLSFPEALLPENTDRYW